MQVYCWIGDAVSGSKWIRTLPLVSICKLCSNVEMEVRRNLNNFNTRINLGSRSCKLGSDFYSSHVNASSSWVLVSVFVSLLWEIVCLLAFQFSSGDFDTCEKHAFEIHSHYYISDFFSVYLLDKVWGGGAFQFWQK